MDDENAIVGGKRCAIEDDDGSGWWVGISPRNGYGALVEGSWTDWVRLAAKVLVREAEENDRELPEWVTDAAKRNWYD